MRERERQRLLQTCGYRDRRWVPASTVDTDLQTVLTSVAQVLHNTSPQRAPLLRAGEGLG